MVKKVPHGDKTIKIELDLWTNDLPRGSTLKTAWIKGTIHILPNKSRGIKRHSVKFNRTSQLTTKIIDALYESGINGKIVEKPDK